VAQAAVKERTQGEIRDDPEEDRSEGAVEVYADSEARTSILPAPTMPPGLAPAVRPEEQGGGGVMGIPNAYSGSRAESAMNKKPFALIKLGHLLCGFRL